MSMLRRHPRCLSQILFLLCDQVSWDGNAFHWNLYESGLDFYRCSRYVQVCRLFQPNVGISCINRPRSLHAYPFTLLYIIVVSLNFCSWYSFIKLTCVVSVRQVYEAIGVRFQSRAGIYVFPPCPKWLYRPWVLGSLRILTTHYHVLPRLITRGASPLSLEYTCTFRYISCLVALWAMHYGVVITNVSFYSTNIPNRSCDLSGSIKGWASQKGLCPVKIEFAIGLHSVSLGDYVPCDDALVLLNF